MDLRIPMARNDDVAGGEGAEVAIVATRTVHCRTIPHKTMNEAVAPPLINQTPDVATNPAKAVIATAPADVAAVETTRPARASAKETATAIEAIAEATVATARAAIAPVPARPPTAGVASLEMVTSATRSLNGVNVLSSAVVAVALAVVASAHAAIHLRRHYRRTLRFGRWTPAVRATFCPTAVGARRPSAQLSVLLSVAPAL